ncbi:MULTISPECIES: hypothetical protein [Streptomyces]|uniref:hypothetical protein n=1 Tax=Streptomyces TaxID=1883 RepID=UPI00073DBB73|nr:hypothetical protein [Streptomyces sp. EAS-AB2608]CUW25634.1 hypothetical protein TUE45_00344 [Streptomyces reticuli]
MADTAQVTAATAAPALRAAGTVRAVAVAHGESPGPVEHRLLTVPGTATGLRNTVTRCLGGPDPATAVLPPAAAPTGPGADSAPVGAAASGPGRRIRSVPAALTAPAATARRHRAAADGTRPRS